jgi:hypothetical protein
MWQRYNYLTNVDKTGFDSVLKKAEVKVVPVL